MGSTKTYFLVKEKQFWEVTVKGKETTTRIGKIGCRGRTYPVKQHGSNEKAKMFARRNVDAKLMQGFLEKKTISKQKTLQVSQRDTNLSWKQPPKKRESVRKIIIRQATTSKKDSTLIGGNSSPCAMKIRGPLKKSKTIRALAREASLKAKLKRGITIKPEKMPIEKQKTVQSKKVRGPLKKSKTIRTLARQASLKAQLKRGITVRPENTTEEKQKTVQGNKIRGPLKKSKTVRLTAVKSVTQTQHKSKRGSPESFISKENEGHGSKGGSTSALEQRNSLMRQETVQLTSDSLMSGRRLSQRLTKMPSLTLGADEIYIPSSSLWPVFMDAPIAWTLRADLPSCPVSWDKLKCVHADDQHMVLGDNTGHILIFSEDGCLQKYFDVRSPVQCFTGDGFLLYVCCKDGSLYDITFDAPRLMSKVGIENVTSMTVKSYITVTNEAGNLATINAFGRVMWSKRSRGIGGWMVCMDTSTVYHGHSGGVTAYHVLDGTELWDISTDRPIYHGVLNQQDHPQHLYVCDGVSITKLSTTDGSTVNTYTHDSTGGLYTVSVGPGGTVFTAGEEIICFEGSKGKVMYQMKHPFPIVHCQYHRGQLFCVGEPGVTVISLSSAVMSNAVAGQRSQPNTLLVSPADISRQQGPLERAPSIQRCDSRGRVTVKCVREDGVLKVIPVSTRHTKNWGCLFPISLCKEGAKFAVDELQADHVGQFYRVFGKIQEIEDS